MAYTPTIVPMSSYRKPLVQTWDGSFNVPLTGGHGQLSNPAGISFSKTGSYAWAFWIKFDADNDVYRQIITLGTLLTDGYRIVKDRSGGNNVICLQEVDGNTADRWNYPAGFDITQWHHICITWKGNSSTSVSTYCYINGHRVTTKATSITWSSAVAATTPLIFGYDWADHTIGGNINDIAFYNRLVYVGEVHDIMNRRAFSNPVGHWKCEDTATFLDSIAGNNLTYYNNVAHQDVHQSWGRTR